LWGAPPENVERKSAANFGTPGATPYYGDCGGANPPEDFWRNPQIPGVSKKVPTFEGNLQPVEKPPKTP